MLLSPGQKDEAKELPKRNVLSEIGKHLRERYFQFFKTLFVDSWYDSLDGVDCS
jgi:hypothetical protein